VLAIIQSRFSSARLPGKALRPLAGRPMLARLLDRLKVAKRVDEIMVATSTATDDDSIAQFCADIRVQCFRGPLDDVAERLAQATESVRSRAFVRINGDSPLISPAVQTRSFPRGQSAEVIRAEALRRARKMMQAGEAEHVTPAFYRRASDFRIANLTSGHDWGAIQMSVDTPDDFALTGKMFRAMGSSTAVLAVEDLIALRERCLANVSA